MSQGGLVPIKLFTPYYAASAASCSVSASGAVSYEALSFCY